MCKFHAPIYDSEGTVSSQHLVHFCRNSGHGIKHKYCPRHRYQYHPLTRKVKSSHSSLLEENLFLLRVFLVFFFGAIFLFFDVFPFLGAVSISLFIFFLFYLIFSALFFCLATTVYSNFFVKGLKVISTACLLYFSFLLSSLLHL